MAKLGNDRSPDADETNLYITQLPEVFSDIQLRELFNRFGPIVTTRVITDQYGKSLCKGFVKFTERAHAEQAIRELNGSCLFNPTNPLRIKFAYKTASNNLSSSSDHGSKFNSLGPIRNNRQHNSRYNPMGGTVNAGPSSIQDTCGMMARGGNNMYGQHSRQPQQVEIPAPSDEMIGSCFHQKQGWSLYVSNLQEESDELSIYKLFSPFGPISSINPMLDKATGKCRGFGFVNMPNYESAFEAVRLMHGVQVAPGKNLNVSFKTNKRNMHPNNYEGVP